MILPEIRDRIMEKVKEIEQIETRRKTRREI
jgi:hypothetical protein